MCSNVIFPVNARRFSGADAPKMGGTVAM
uniref:Uncharacterized protein n=1 Tax=Anguilla anguilla TaxID=7936 RepID=A0A0E9X9G4_ANGAN